MGLIRRGRQWKGQDHGLRTFSQLTSWKHKFSLEVHVTRVCEEVGVIGGGVGERLKLNVTQQGTQ